MATVIQWPVWLIRALDFSAGFAGEAGSVGILSVGVNSCARQKR
jgi:hypothetical protein